ncbi:MAG: hypothetical protein ACJAZ2_001373 [Glaciecola sp.]|jgi:hypothetical protein
MNVFSKKRVLLIFVLAMAVEVLYFAPYIPLVRNISPYITGEIIIKGQACTCPDEKVLVGEGYLKANTPDSLMKYNLDYSELFISEMPAEVPDYQGVGVYAVKGKIVGKERVYKGDRWNPYFEMESWRHIDSFNQISIYLFLSIQALLFMYLIKRRK